MLLDCGGFSNAYRGGIRHGGAYELKQATWAFKHSQLSPTIQDDPIKRAAMAAEDIGAWFQALPWKRGHSPLRWAPEYEECLFEQWERGTFDDYWRQPEFYAAGYYPDFDGLSVMSMCGWWDPYAQTATENFIGISRQPQAQAFLVLGPWTHGQRSVTFAGDVDFGEAATLDGQLAENYLEFRLDWFNRTLKGAAPAGAEIPRVRYFRMGGGSGRRRTQGRLDHGGCWQTAADWPIPGTEFRPYYLHSNGTLRESAPEDTDAALSYDFDPANPVPTIGGAVTSGEPLMEAGAYDQRTTQDIFAARAPFLPLAARRDILVFQTAPLEHDIEITGPITVRLWISSSAPDTDFTAKLIDVHPPNSDYPQGYAMNLCDGILRCRYARSWQKPQLLSPDEIIEIGIEPMPTSNLFLRGHCIRLDISSSNFPHFDVNPNTGEPEGRALRRQIATNTVHTSNRYPSHIVLPIVPTGAGQL
jgi:putative CocE/NonD family hydrolase